MKRHALVALVVVSAVGIVALAAKKFWEQKEFPDWSKKEIQQMITKSPWAREVTLRPSIGNLGGASSTEGGGSLGGVQAGPASFTVMVRWYSALPVKHALAAHRHGADAQADEELGRERTHYEIGVSGETWALLSDSGSSESTTAADPWQAMIDRLKSESFLKSSGREPIQAVELEMRNAPDWDATDGQEMGARAEFLMRFPRTPALTLEDKQVEFVTIVGGEKVKRKFKLKDMVYKGNLEL